MPDRNNSPIGYRLRYDYRTGKPIERYFKKMTVYTNPRWESMPYMPHMTAPEVVITPKPDLSTPKKENDNGGSSKSVTKSTTPKQGETVAQMWTRITGLSWKTAKELGITDGSYANNIEILRAMRRGEITKDSVMSLIANTLIKSQEQAIPSNAVQDNDSDWHHRDYDLYIPEAAPQEYFAPEDDLSYADLYGMYMPYQK